MRMPVSASPVFVGAPSFAYPDFVLPDDSYETYAAFTTRAGGRTEILWVGANDGMLHGFDAATG